MDEGRVHLERDFSLQIKMKDIIVNILNFLWIDKKLQWQNELP